MIKKEKTGKNGYVLIRIPVMFAMWLESIIKPKFSSSVIWHGRIPPRRDTIAMRTGKLLIESLAQHVYIPEALTDPVFDERKSVYPVRVSITSRIFLQTDDNIEKLINGAREFRRTITTECYQRCLQTLTAEEFQQYSEFVRNFKKGIYVPVTPAILKAIASKQGQAGKQALNREDSTPTSPGDA